MIRKTNRKNKTNIQLVYPTTSLWTLKELFELNASVKQITVRTKVTPRIEANEISVVGSKPQPKGRPQLVFSFNPTKQVLDEAVSKGINLSPKYVQKDIPVLNINPANNNPADKAENKPAESEKTMSEKMVA